MMNVQKLLAVGIVASGAALVFASPASAHRFRFRDPFGGHHPGRPNVQANAQCLRNCGQLDQLCLQSARSDAQNCANTNCTTERQAAQDTCRADRTSADCQSARNAFRTCLQPCRDNLSAASSACRNSKQTCVATCAGAVPTQPDPQCIAGCRTTLQTCNLGTSTDAQGCFVDCNPLITTAQQTCASDPGASTCTTALQAAQGCVNSCNQIQRAALQKCLQDSQSCIAACPNVPPTPVPGT
jgi:hypothetical protein